MSEIIRCKRCNRVLTNKESIERGYGKFCYKIISLQEQKISLGNDPLSHIVLEELLNRVRKLELDNNFMKHQLKHKVFVNSSNNSDSEWDIPKEVKEVRNQFKIEFTVIVKELKVIFNTDNFDYHNVLKPIEPRSEPEIIENLELILN